MPTHSPARSTPTGPFARPQRRALLTAIGIVLTAGSILAAPLAATAAPAYVVEDTLTITPGVLRYMQSFYNPANESTYLLNSGARLVSVIAPDNTVTEIPVPGAQEMTLDADGNVWVGGSGEASGRNVTRIAPDLTTATAAITGSVTGIAFNAATGRIEVVNSSGDVFSVGADLAVTTWDTGLDTNVSTLAVNATTGDVYVGGTRSATSETGVWVYSSTGAELTLVPTSSPATLLYNPVTERVYATRGNGIVVIDADRTSTTLPTSTNLLSHAVALSDGRVSVNTLSQNVVTIVGTDNSVTELTTPFPGAAAMDAGGTTYQAIESGVLITRADGSTTTLPLTPNVLYGSVVFNAATNRVIVADLNTGGVSIIAAVNSPEITTLTVPNGTVDTAYAAQIDATGDATITYVVTTGTLPDGLTLNTATGAITGTPTTAGDSTFTITATNSAGSDDQAYTMNVAAVTATAPVITTPSLAAGTVDAPYSALVEATGSPAATFAVTEGTLPAGLALNATTGAVTGTPTTVGSSTFTVTATNTAGTDTREYTIAIAAVTPGEGNSGGAGAGTGTGGSLADTGFGGDGAATAAIALLVAGGAALGTTALVRKRRQSA